MIKKIFIFFILILPLFIISQNFDGLKVYVWDNDYGAIFYNPDNSTQLIGYEYNLLKSFSKLGFNQGTNLFYGDTLPRRFSMLNDYAAIFIVTGHHPIAARNQMFTSSQIDSLSRYLDAGGCVYFEGNNVMEYLKINYPVFYGKYFNDTIVSTPYSRFIDTLITNTSFCRDYIFAYPTHTVADSGVDYLYTKDPTIDAPYYYNVLNYDERNKLYRSTATAYTPPESKDGKYYYFRGRVFVQTVDLGAFSNGDGRLARQLPDSTKNILMRTSYLRDILRFFGLAQTLLVVDDKSDTIATSVYRVFSRSVDFDTVFTRTSSGPSYTTLARYNSVFWYSDSVDYPLTLTDTVNISTYLDFGGNLFFSSMNVAEQFGSNNLFLRKYLGINLVSDSFGTNTIYGKSFWETNPITDSFTVIKPSTNYEPDEITIYDQVITDTAFIASGRPNHLCGTYTSNGSFKTVFLTFPFQNTNVQLKAGYPTDSIIKITLQDIFNYDLNFDPLYTSTENYDFECNYKIEKDRIVVNIFVDRYFNGHVRIKLDGKDLLHQTVSGKDFEFSLNKVNGRYTVELMDDKNITLFLKTFDVFEIKVNNNIPKICRNIFQIKSDQDFTVEVFDISGRRVLSLTSKDKTATVDLSQHKTGLYFIKLSTEKLPHPLLKLGTVLDSVTF
ncbi:MAG: hypothetical protein XD76_0555 [candidate division TA06 bacterium 32_111]|uniref:Secretion system C-terminal sorting domain-containing protein n=2 Tax=Bacteria candidate phyla TaxID=1783234 RepID=A0A101I2B7_UNCT6|nr:MAG: hypothetical protein XD76_0555 [candidate division TA06 bacterium 32_111]KUK86550.1 MAG: hypothetical protein XE03_1426 [candidate division TA06 bacterium 34_109]HAF07899.1 hypothetical protein [candidate division WOR-3 bacterium]HCP16399.1 hypothetical protein [candidate division WOR-3 bacterium]